jgi:hypothetical protein
MRLILVEDRGWEISLGILLKIFWTTDKEEKQRQKKQKQKTKKQRQRHFLTTKYTNTHENGAVA